MGNHSFKLRTSHKPHGSTKRSTRVTPQIREPRICGAQTKLNLFLSVSSSPISFRVQRLAPMPRWNRSPGAQGSAAEATLNRPNALSPAVTFAYSLICLAVCPPAAAGASTLDQRRRTIHRNGSGAPLCPHLRTPVLYVVLISASLILCQISQFRDPGLQPRQGPVAQQPFGPGPPLKIH